VSAGVQFDLTAEEAEVFLQEADELLLQLNEGLVELESSPDHPDLVQGIFRAAHTLKGSAGVIGHHRMAEVLHAMESLLDRVRHGQLSVSTDLIDVLLQGADVVRVLVGEVAAVVGGQPDGAGPSELDPSRLIESLRAFESDAGSVTEAVAQWQKLDLPEGQQADSGAELWEIRGRIDADSIAPGARALQVLLSLQQCSQVLVSIPGLEDLDDEWRGRTVQALVLTEDTGTLRGLLDSISEVQMEYVPRSGGSNGAEEATATGPSPEGTATPAAGRPQGQVRWVRTSVERLDSLMNLVSELVTDRNRLLQVRQDLERRFGEQAELAELAEALAHVSTITDQLQDEVMRARMVPIELVFSRFPRVVRDLARQLGKQIELVIEGQETELDRTVIEEISDPIMHLVRNCVDHGIEPPEARRRAGKPEKGRLRLAGRSEESHIIVTVEDDGAGIDPDALRKAAVQRGVLDYQTAQGLSDQEAVELIFRAGFSTARQVSDISGRGVGMDVVQAHIQRLNGSVTVQSNLGQGTRFELKLPLTLAIFPALMVEVGGSAYAIPLTSVVEALQVPDERLLRVQGRETIISRGRVLPVLSLERFFGCAQNGSDGLHRIVEVRWGDTSVGLAVSRLLGRQEVVIKPLGRMVGEVPGIAGGTIMGDGRVALILDMGSLIRAGYGN
jgi:two-component system chemotaxis sensor kinase CheA